MTGLDTSSSPARITIWSPTGPEGEALASLIKGVLPEADVHLGPLPSPLRFPPVPPLCPDPDLVWQIEGHQPTIQMYREAAERALLDPMSFGFDPHPRTRRWWQRLWRWR